MTPEDIGRYVESLWAVLTYHGYGREDKIALIQVVLREKIRQQAKNGTLLA